MKIRHLKLVKAVSEEGSLTGAAHQMHLSQSALSHQLRSLEEELGVSVFNRVNKRLVLTQAGHLLLESSKKVLRELNKTKHKIEKLVEGEMGTIRLSTECYTCYHWLPPIIKEFGRRYPKVEVQIKTDSEGATVEKLLKGELDIAFVHRKVADKNLTYTEFIDDELVAIFHADHPFRKKEVIMPKDFKAETLILHSKNFESSTLNQQVLSRYDITPANIIYVQLTGAALEMVASNLGITVMPRWIARGYLERKKLEYRPVTNNGLLRKWKIATLNDELTPSYISHFIGLLKDKQEHIFEMT